MRVRTEEQIREDLQLKIYVWAVITHLYPNGGLVRWGIHNTRYNFTKWNGPAVKVSELNKEMDNISELLNRQWSRLRRNDNYEPEKCSLCWKYGGCPLMQENKCPLYTKKESEKMKSGSLEDVVRALRKAELEKLAIEEKLKNIMESREPMIVDGIQVGFLPSYSKSVEISNLLKFCNKIEIPVYGVDIAENAAEKIIKKSANMLDVSAMPDYQQILKNITRTTFKYK
jgi:hypothetical protein